MSTQYLFSFPVSSHPECITCTICDVQFVKTPLYQSKSKPLSLAHKGEKLRHAIVVCPLYVLYYEGQFSRHEPLMSDLCPFIILSWRMTCTHYGHGTDEVLVLLCCVFGEYELFYVTSHNSSHFLNRPMIWETQFIYLYRHKI